MFLKISVNVKMQLVSLSIDHYRNVFDNWSCETSAITDHCFASLAIMQTLCQHLHRKPRARPTLKCLICWCWHFKLENNSSTVLLFTCVTQPSPKSNSTAAVPSHMLFRLGWGWTTQSRTSQGPPVILQLDDTPRFCPQFKSYMHNMLISINNFIKNKNSLLTLQLGNIPHHTFWKKHILL